jgi:RimJ/RimL family protein N-acetyltransferase/aryl carrier-like protein
MLSSIDSSRREKLRGELAELLDVDASELTDDARLVDDLSFDSLTMLTLFTWLADQGVRLGPEHKKPARVADLWSLLDTNGFQLSIRTTNGQDFGPAHVPRPPQPAADPLVPVLESGTFRLAPLQPSDVPLLYTLAVRPENCFRWRYRGAPPSPERFTDELWNHVLVQYAVRRRSDGKLAGHVVAYGADQHTSHAYVGAIFDPEYAGAGFAAEIVEVFSRHLFQVFPLRKIYLEIPGYNWPQMRSGEGRYFRVEGVLQEHAYHAGRYWEQYICAIYPEGSQSEPNPKEGVAS